mgnify:CR=1 FL=1
MDQLQYAPAGTAVWVLTQEWPRSDRCSVIGVFTSRDGALRFLAEDVLGTDVAGQIAWGCSPDDPYYWEGVGSDERRFILVLEFVDGPYQLAH